MRLSFVATLIILFASCHKEDSRINDLKAAMQGKWELREFSCFECVPPTPDYPPGNGNLLVFTASSGFEKRQHDTLVFKGTYDLHRTTECKKTGEIILTTNETPFPESAVIEVSGDNLYLSTPSCLSDGAFRAYKKVE